MERPVEVAVFQGGQLQTLRTLSPRLEWRAAALAGTSSAVMVLVAMAVTGILVSALGLVVHTPTFVVSWFGVALGVAVLSVRHARTRARRYALGVRIDSDSFGAVDVDLVRRVGNSEEYDIGLVPGMTGVFEHGRTPLPVESLTRNGPVRIGLPPEGHVYVEYGPTTFVISRRSEVVEPQASFAEQWARTITAARRLMPLAALGVPVAALATLLGAVPASALPDTATPLEIQQHIHGEAQRQVNTLYQCFDSLPMSCQRQGYVGVGLSLSKEGNVRSHWVAKSTFDQDCPVTQCMANVVAGWSFEPMPNAFELVVPIQVLRSERPLYDPRSAGTRPMVDQSDGDAGAFEVSAGEWMGR